MLMRWGYSPLFDSCRQCSEHCLNIIRVHQTFACNSYHFQHFLPNFNDKHSKVVSGELERENWEELSLTAALLWDSWASYFFWSRFLSLMLNFMRLNRVCCVKSYKSLSRDKTFSQILFLFLYVISRFFFTNRDQPILI